MRFQFIIAKVCKKALPVPILFFISLSTVSALSLPPLLFTQVPHQQETNSLVQFIGSGEPQIQVIKGVPSPGLLDVLSQMFKGARWLFYPDGRFMYVPAENPTYRGLFSISGSYKRVGDTIEFQGEGSTYSGASASLDGLLRIDGKGAVLEVNIVTSGGFTSEISHISQTLSLPSAQATRSVENIQGFQVPSYFKISLQGSTEAGAFGPLPTTLKILPSSKDDSNPFFVDIRTDGNPIVHGGFLWYSFSHQQTDRKEFYSKITINENQVHLAANPSQQLYRDDVSWKTLTSGVLAILLKNEIVGVNKVSQASMSFTIQNRSITGNIIAKGTSWFGSHSRYEANFTGEMVDDLTIPSTKRLSLKSVKSAIKKEPSPIFVSSSEFLPDRSFQKNFYRSFLKGENKTDLPFEGTWNVEIDESFRMLTLQQNERRVWGTYTGRGGGTIDGIVEGNRLDFT